MIVGRRRGFLPGNEGFHFRHPLAESSFLKLLQTLDWPIRVVFGTVCSPSEPTPATGPLAPDRPGRDHRCTGRGTIHKYYPPAGRRDYMPV